MIFWRFSLILPIVMLGGCVTISGLKQDIANSYNSVTGYIAKMVDPVKEAKKQLPIYDGVCPAASVRPDLARLVDFASEENPVAGNISSEVWITGIRNICRVEGESLVMQIDIALAGKTGPKGRIKPNDQPNFAYPYFVAVTDAQGNVLSKEIFAATLSYGRSQNETQGTESIFQNMPFPDTASGEVFNVVLGFQLSDVQLGYNNRTPAVPVSHNQ